MDIFSVEKRSEIMSKIKARDTKPELLMRKHLFKLGLRYRVNVRNLPGKPDIVFRKYKTAIFVDGDWWHGRHYDKEASKYTLFWQNKIKTNVERDMKVTKQLEDKGWKVFRFWQKDLSKAPDEYAGIILDHINSIKR